MSYQPEPCPHCKGSGIEPRPAGVTHQIGAPSCNACWGTGKKDSDTTAKLMMASGRLYGEIHAATSNTEQAITRTAEQSHLTALAERGALTAQVEALTETVARRDAELDRTNARWLDLRAEVETLTAQRDEAVRLLEVNIATFEVAPTSPSVLLVAMGQAAALLRGVER